MSNNEEDSGEEVSFEEAKIMAEQGDAEAQYYIGTCYYYGEEIAQNYYAAVRWFRKAAEQGDDDAQYRLGLCYKHGHGTKSNNELAVKWFTKAANNGHCWAQYKLGELYDYGCGDLREDDRKAAEWYLKAAEQGNEFAQCRLAYCYYNGAGVPQDYDKAVIWWGKAAEQGYMEALSCMGDCYYHGHGVPKDNTLAAEWYIKAAKLGHYSSIFGIGHCQQNDNDYDKTIEWLKKSAEKNYDLAQYGLGMVFYYGEENIQEDRRAAAEWFAKAAKQDLAIAQFMLGRCYYRGEGVTKNKKTAIKWLTKAAEQGNEDAQDFLDDINTPVVRQPALKPPTPEAQEAYDRGKAYYKDGDNENALKEYNRAISLSPDFVEAYDSRGWMYYILKDYDCAIKDYTEEIRLAEQGISKSGHRYDGYAHRADVYMELKDYDKAISDYTDALESPGMTFFAYAKRGDAYYAKKDYRNAYYDYDSAIECVEGTCSTDIFRRGKAAARLGWKEMAISDFEEVLRKTPDNKDAKKELRKLIGDEKFFQLDPQHKNMPATASMFKKLKWLEKHAESNQEYVLTLTEDQTITAQTLAFPGKRNITIRLMYSDRYGPKTLSLEGKGSLFTIGDGVTLILEKGITLTLDNYDKKRYWESNNASLVYVGSGGTLVMNSGAKIKNNICFHAPWFGVESETRGNGGGVYVDSKGVFKMFGGEITGNRSFSDGGGVYVYSGGKFIMDDGIIHGNSGPDGGGVAVYRGMFKMNGGRISDNRSNDNYHISQGGGVNICDGKFLMTGGVIAGNTVREHGGGIHIDGHSAKFTMEGGVISGNKACEGGGVEVSHGATFIMKNGVIAGNAAVRSGGGGVYVSEIPREYEINKNEPIGVFNMLGGEIYGNTGVKGGGVHLWGCGSFVMEGGRIAGNVASEHGGAVYINKKDGARFVKTGGVVYGNTKDGQANRVVRKAKGKGTNNKRGHGICGFIKSEYRYRKEDLVICHWRDNTADIGDNIDTDKAGVAGGWEYSPAASITENN